MTPLDPLGTDLDAFRIAMLEFYRSGRRDLPWRRNADPYRVLVSEMMLQQTRVETVIPYFHGWMERFPDLQALADADQEEVLRLWQGLGYYSRARNLHRAVREVGERYDGRIPDDPDELRSLPGIGPYTAGAVASIAYGVPVGAVDGNVRRVLSRLMDEPAPSPKGLRAWADRLVDPEAPGEFNQALMELGSTVCTPRSPDCAACPVGEHCLARARGTQEDRPKRRPRKAVPRVTEAVVALVARGARAEMVLLRKRPNEGLLGGMWELPGVRLEDSAEPTAGEVTARAGALACSLLPGDPLEDGAVRVRPRLLRRLAPVEHAFSHLHVRYVPHVYAWEGDAASGEAIEGGSGLERVRLRWISLSALDRVPLPAAQVRILALLDQRH